MLLYFIFGALGSLLKDIIQDNCLVLPSIKEGKFYMGFFGGMIIGAVAGYLTDNSLIMAFTSGFTGASVITMLTAKKKEETVTETPSIEEQIKSIALEYGVDQVLALNVANCESRLNIKATNTNSDGSIDRGLYQINNKGHPEVTDEQAFNPEYSIRFFCKAVKEGHLGGGNSSKSCWAKQ